MNAEAKIKALEKRISALEAKAGLRPSRIPTDRSKMPVNHIAYERAIAATVQGDRNALRDYCRMYRIPT